MKTELDHSTWHWREEGDGTGTPVIWIHGFPLSSRVWDEQLAIPGVRHILPDLPGFGDSPAPRGPLTIDQYAEGITAILDQTGSRSGVVAGLSMGGYIALAVARRAMERLCGMILVDTRETPDTKSAREGRFESIRKVGEEGTGPIVETMLPKMFTEETIRKDSDRTARLRQIMESASPDGVKVALRAMAERGDATDLLPRIEVPVLVVVGREDTITPPADAERMRDAIPGADLVLIDEAAHLSNLERPEEFNRAAGEFLARIQPRR